MPLKRWHKLNQKIVFENPHWSYRLDQFQIDNAVKGEYHYVHTNGSSMVVPVTESGEIIMLNQFRYLNQKESIEFPCGSVDENISHIQNAHKELREETGYDAKNIFKVGEFCPYTGAADEMCSVFVATDLFKSPLPKDSTEEFEILFQSFDDVDNMISNNSIWDGLSICAWTLAKSKVKNILESK